MKIKNKIYNFLRYSEKWTGTDMVYIAKGGSWLTLGQFFSMASALLLSIAFANLLPKETYGIYKYILSVSSLLLIPTLSGMNSAISQSTAKGYEGSLIPATKTSIKWGLIGGAASLILAGYYYFNSNINLSLSFLIISVFIPLMDPLNTYGAYLEGKKLFDLSTKFRIISQVFITAITASVLFFSNNLLLIIFTYFTIRTFFRAIFFKITLIKVRPNKNIDSDTINYGKQITLINVILLIAAQLDKLLIWHYFGAIELAIYSFAINPPEQIRGLFKNINSLAFPKLSSTDIITIKKTLPNKINKLLLINIFIAIIYILTAPAIFKIIFPQYLASIIYSQLFILSIALTPLYLYNTVFVAKKQKKILYFITASTTSIKFILLLVLLPTYGIMGGIVSLLGTQIYNNIASIYLFKKI